MRKQVSTIKTLMKYLGARKYWILVSLVLALGSVGLSLYIPVLTGQAVDLALGRGTVDMAGIGGILLKIGVCAGALALVQWMMSAVNNRLSFDTSRDIRLAAFRKIAKLPLKTIDAQPLGDIVSRVMSDVEQLSDGVLMGFTQLFTGVITILGTLIFMLVKQPLIAAAVVPAVFLLIRVYRADRLEPEPSGLLLSLILRGVFGNQAGGIIPCRFDMAGSVRCGTVIVAGDHRVDRLDAALVIGADRNDHDDQLVRETGADADLRRGAEHHRPDVERAAGAVGRDVIDIVTHDGLDRLDELFDREFRHQQMAGRTVEPPAVLLGAEDTDLSVAAAERLAAFEDRLPVVENVRGDRHGDVVVGAEPSFIPAAVFVMETDVAPGRHEFESKIFPVDVHDSIDLLQK